MPSAREVCDEDWSGRALDDEQFESVSFVDVDMSEVVGPVPGWRVRRCARST